MFAHRTRFPYLQATVVQFAIDYYRLGVLTGEMAADILLGKKQMSDLEVLTSEPTKVYNEDICKSLGITVPAV